MSEETQPAAFDKFSKLPAALVPTSLKVMVFSGRFVKVEDQKKWFDWPEFKAAIDNYKGDDLTFDKFKNTTITRSEAKVTVIVDKIVKFLLDALSVSIDVKELAATIEATFTNLKQAKSNGWANWSTSNVETNSSWEYRIAFAVPNPDLAEYFYTLVTTIKLEADIRDETGWFGLTSSSSKNFSTIIDAMELVVAKGFKGPSN